MLRMSANSISKTHATTAVEPNLTVLWLSVAASIVLHNSEEWLLDMTGWIADHPWLPGRSLHGDQAEIALLLALVAAAVVGLSLTAVILKPPWSAEVLVCVAYALMVNAASHSVLSLLSVSMMPGVITGLLVLLPLGLLIVRVLPPVEWTVATVGATAAVACGITAGAYLLATTISGIR